MILGGTCKNGHVVDLSRPQIIKEVAPGFTSYEIYCQECGVIYSARYVDTRARDDQKRAKNLGTGNEWASFKHFADCQTCDKRDGNTCTVKHVTMKKSYYNQEMVHDFNCTWYPRVVPPLPLSGYRDKGENQQEKPKQKQQSLDDHVGEH